MMAMMMKSTKRQPGCQSCPTGLSVRDYTEQPSFKKRRKKNEKVFFEAKSKSLFGYKRDDNALFVQERGVSLGGTFCALSQKLSHPCPPHHVCHNFGTSCQKHSVPLLQHVYY